MSQESQLLTTRKFYSRVFIAVLVVVLLSSRTYFAPRGIWLGFLCTLGYLLVIAGVLGRIYASLAIGGQKNTMVVRQGLFSVVRNPLYVFSFVAAVGCAMQTGMLSIVLVVVLAFAFYYPRVVAGEERHLLSLFGEEYEIYMREVPRWKPNFSLWQEPEYIEIRPVFVYKTMRDAMVFFLALPVFDILTYLHNKKILWAWFRLP